MPLGAMKQASYAANIQNWLYDVGADWAGGAIVTSVLDTDNNLYVSGMYGTATADSTYVIKFNAEGVVQWGKFYGRPGFNLVGPSKITDMTTDTDFVWTVSETSNATGGYNGMRILKINKTTGSLEQDYYWDTTGPSLDTNPLGITIANNNLIISNDRQTSGDYQGIISMTKAGSINWTAVVGTAGTARYNPATRPSTDSSHNVYVASARTISSNVVVQVTKFDSSGVGQWDKYFNGYANGNVSELYGRDLQVNADSVYVLLQNQNWWGDGSSTNGNLIKLDTTGAVIWQVALIRPTGYTFSPERIAFDGQGNIYVCGQGSNSPLAAFLGVVYKFDTSGNLQWVRQFENVTVEPIDRAITIDIDVGTQDQIAVSLNSEPNGWTILSLPTDGGQTGTYLVSNANVKYGTTTATSVTSNLVLTATTTSSGTYSATNFGNATTTTANVITVTGNISVLR